MDNRPQYSCEFVMMDIGFGIRTLVPHNTHYAVFEIGNWLAHTHTYAGIQCERIVGRVAYSRLCNL